MVLLVRGSTMEIEKNREGRIHQLESEVTNMATEVIAWVKEGDLRSELAGTVLQIRVTVLEMILKSSETQFKESDEDLPHLNHQTDAISSLRLRIRLLSYWLGLKLAKFQRSEEEDVAVDEELQSSAAMEGPLEASTGELGDEEEGDGSKEESAIDNSHAKVNDERHSSAARFSIAISPGENQTKVDDGIERDNEPHEEEEGLSEIHRNKVDFEFKEELKDDGSNAINHHAMYTEEVERDFEKKVLKEARELQSENAFWFVGLTGQEPVFLLAMGTDQIGSKAGPDPKSLGPPPWYEFTIKDFGPTIFPNKGADSITLKFGTSLELMGPFSRPISFLSAHGNESVHVGLPIHASLLYGGWGNCIEDQNRFGPSSENIDPPPWLAYEIWEAHQNSSCLQPPELHSSIRPRPREHISKRRCTLPPPTQPPEFPLKLSRLELFITVSIFLGPPCPIYLHISSKADAAGHDPGDIRFHRLPSSWAFNFNFKHNLEGKACFKGLAKAKKDLEEQCQQDRVLGEIAVHWIVGGKRKIASVIAGEISWNWVCLDENTVVLRKGLSTRAHWPTAQQPPPSSFNCLAHPDFGRKPIEWEHLHLGPPLSGRFVSPIWPCLLLEFQLDLFSYQEGRGSNMSFKLKPPPKMPPHPDVGTNCTIFTNFRGSASLQLNTGDCIYSDNLGDNPTSVTSHQASSWAYGINILQKILWMTFQIYWVGLVCIRVQLFLEYNLEDKVLLKKGDIFRTRNVLGRIFGLMAYYSRSRRPCAG